ncbi:trithorax group protein osa-like isoform X2 [Lytechinus variegatus]|uniref:trithorax group protein osa-like isoform X2 n=1 Tax=Lytechinus variegatus TaxID=7654 RepID=UPI001BB27745|nr:trithorax group protein osa-like isoform X2 [Lytechinus variegatus]
MSEEEQMYEFNPEYEEESSTDSKPSSIPPISTFTKGSGNGAEAFPTGLYNSKDNTHSMANLESNNNDSSNTDSSSESMSVASPSQQKLSQQPQETQQQPTQHQQLLPQPQAYNPAATDFPYTNQVLVTSSSPQETNGVLPSHVIHSGPLPTAMAPTGMPLPGHPVIPFMASSSSTSGPTPSIISSGGPEQMVQYSSSAMHLLTSTAQPVYSMPAPGPTSASIIHVNDTVPVQPTVLPHNIDLQHHLQHQLQQQQHPPKNGSAEEKEDQNDDSRKISLATLVSHAQMQPPVQAGSNPRPGLPPHLMQLNPPAQTMSSLGGPVQQHFVPGPGPIPIQGSIATGNYGNAQVLPPQQQQQQQQQVPTSVVCMPPHMGPPPHGMVEQPNPMIGAGPGPGGIGMPDGVEDSQQSPGSSGARRNNKRRGNKRDVPNDEKDARYYERRDRNNKAAKRSRDARKIREEQVGMRAHYLEKENDFLRAQLNTLREEANSLRLLLAQRPPVNQMQPTGQPPMQ